MHAGRTVQQYRVIDLRTGDAAPNETIVEARSPEAAAQGALGLELVRSGPKHELRARVYFQHDGQPVSMVRLYARRR